MKLKHMWSPQVLIGKWRYCSHICLQKMSWALCSYIKFGKSQSSVQWVCGITRKRSFSFFSGSGSIRIMYCRRKLQINEHYGKACFSNRELPITEALWDGGSASQQDVWREHCMGVVITEGRYTCWNSRKKVSLPCSDLETVGLGSPGLRDLKSKKKAWFCHQMAAQSLKII